jgi:hypothetical protein
VVHEDARQRESLIDEMERLRGSVYLREGALRRGQLTPDGRHHTPVDNASWHLLTLDASGRVGGCVRLYVHPNTVSFENLTVSRAALAHAERGAYFRTCVETELKRARRLGVPFVELGGWALSDELRYSAEAVRIALSAFAWGRLLGGAIGITTATTRNHSSSILSRIGGRSMDDVPVYFDPQYGCDMAILRFEAFSCAPKYDPIVSSLANELAYTPVYAEPVPSWELPTLVSQPAFAFAATA